MVEKDVCKCVYLYENIKENLYIIYFRKRKAYIFN